MGTAAIESRTPLGGRPPRRVGADAVLRYLAQRGLLDTSEVDDSFTQVTNLSCSHAVWLVSRRNGGRLIVKQGRPRPGSLRADLGVEHILYRLSAGVVPILQAIVPRCRWLDPRRQVLVLDGVEPGETLNMAVLRCGPTIDLARQLSTALAVCHSISGPPLRHLLPPHFIWVLGIFRPGAWRPPGAARLLPPGPIAAEIAGHFAALERRPRLTSLVHGDVRWENCLVERSPPAVRLIDWETAGLGDPAWDLAGVIQEHLRLRLLRPRLGSSIDASLDAFLAGYRDQTSAAWHSAIESAVRLAGARLLQTALEHVAAGTPPAEAALLVSHAIDVLRRPERALPS